MTGPAAQDRRGLDEPDEVGPLDETRIGTAHVGPHTVARASGARVEQGRRR